jgi:hypothetical protein
VVVVVVWLVVVVVWLLVVVVWLVGVSVPSREGSSAECAGWA